MKRLAIYSIKTEYVDWLMEFDKNVMWPKNDANFERPYVGIIIKIHNHLYFAPLTHKGKKWAGYGDHVVIRGGQFGAICLNCMIPINELVLNELVSIVDFNKYINSPNFHMKVYGLLLRNQHRFINKSWMLEKIKNRANNAYMKNQLGKTTYYSCNFQILESAADKWIERYKFNSLSHLTKMYELNKNNVY